MKDTQPACVRFGAFELELNARTLRKTAGAGVAIRIVLPEQPFRLLLMLIEREGAVATRQEIQKKLWPNDTVVEFEHSINTAIARLRKALEDPADNPGYIETIAKRGYRLMVPVEWVGSESAAADPSEESSADSSDAVPSRADAERSRGRVGRLAVDDSEALSKAKLKVGRLTGKVVSHYRVLEVIGGGGMGLVYRAEDLKLGRAVALKFLPEEVGDDPKARERFDREAHAVSALSHPNICPIYEFAEHEEQPFIVMELLQGKNLRDHLAIGRFCLNEPEGLEIAIQIASGLEAAHEKGIIHRDIKPANIFITEKNVAKILDFGVAKVMQLGEPETAAAAVASDPVSRESGATHLTRTGIRLGTAGYMSPEQVRGEPLDVRTDIFSFGLVLYEMATGERAFTGETEAILHDAIQHREPKPVRALAPTISPELESIVGKCLEKERDRRYQTVDDLRNGLELIQNGTATPKEITPQRKRWKYAAAAIAVIAILAGGLYYRLSRNAHKLTDKDTIVLADFENHTGDAVFDGALNTALTVELQQSPFLNLLASDKVRATLKQMNRPEAEKMSPATALEVCRWTRSTALVTGSVGDVGNHYKLLLKATDCRTGKEWTEADGAADSRNQIVHTLGDVGYGLRSKLGEPKASLLDFNQPLDVATSASPEALEAFTRGRNEQNAKGDSAALPYLRKAVDVDPQFALAHVRLGSAYWNLNERKLALESFGEAFELRDRATKHDRFQVEGQYYWVANGELEKSVDGCRDWASAYPREYLPHAYLAYYLRLEGEFQNAIDEARESIRLNPYDYHAVYNLMTAETAMDRPEEAKAAYDEARSRNVDTIGLREKRYEVAFLQRDEASMEEQVTWAAGSPGAAILVMEQYSTDTYYGRFAKARERAQRAVAAARQGNIQDQAVKWTADEALTEAEVGNTQKADELLRLVAGLNVDPDTETSAALVLARANRATEAEHLEANLGQQFPLGMIVNHRLPSIKAAIELSRNNPSGAVKALQPAARNAGIDLGIDLGYQTYLRGLAYLHLAKPLKAQTEFQRIIDHPGIVVNHLVGALARLQLARAQAMTGDKDAARKSYQDFLTLWKDADPDIPIYRQAKAEYKKLQ